MKSNMYFMIDNGISRCGVCSDMCTTCFGPDKNQCSSCVAPGYLLDSGQCISCSQFCDTCETNKCLTCSAGYYIQEWDN